MNPDLAARYAEQTKTIKQGNYGASGGFATAAVTGKPLPTKTKIVKPGGLPGIVTKAADVGKQIADLSGKATLATGNFILHSSADIAQAAINTVKLPYTAASQIVENNNIHQQQKVLDAKQTKLFDAHRSGKISQADYVKALDDITQSYQALSKQSEAIFSGPTPVQRAGDLVETAVNVLSLGSFTTEAALGKEVAGSMVGNIEKALTKVPALRVLAEKNAATIAKTAVGETFDQTLKRQGKQIAVGLLIKRPIFYQQNIEGGKDVYKHILEGNYPAAAKSAAWLGVQMLEGGPVGAALRGTTKLKGKLGKLAYGSGSLIDELSKQIGNKNPAQIARFLTTIEKKSPQEFEKANKIFQILQESNLQSTKNNVKQAVENILTHYTQHGIPLEDLTPSQLYKDFGNWAAADELAQKTLRSGLVKGISPEDASKYVVVRWDQATRNAVAGAIEKAGTNIQTQLEVLNEMANRPGVGWGNNELLRRKLETIISSGKTPMQLAAEIRAIDTAATILGDVPSKVAKELADLGYSIAAPVGGRITPIIDTNDLRKLVSSAIKGDSSVFDAANAPNPLLAGIAGALTKAGLSPQAANQTANRVLQQNVVANLDELGLGKQLGFHDSQGGDIVTGGKIILSKLQAYVENKSPVLGLGQKAAITDIRQLTYKEIQEALKVSGQEAKTISQAIMKGYTDVPLEFRGLGDKVVDNLYRFNPLQKYYSRLQSALRYTYNPFFRVQERVETKLLSHVQANNLVWGRSRQELNDAAQLLDNGGIFTSSLPGEAAQDQVLGRLTANITQGQKRDLAGLALAMAKNKGVTLPEMISQHSNEIEDALRVVVQYPKEGVLASSLARTLNTAFFPVRYNAKVTLLAAQVIAKQPPSVQAAILRSVFTMKDWLKSDEGIKWQSTHADAIQLLQWITPINSIQATFNLIGHKPNSISDLGQLGGLPLGVISQMLDSQGIINLNRPYVDPKTGDVFPKNTPITLQARLATALTDLLGSTFTYPGRILGLPGKEATLKKVVKAFIDTNGTEFDAHIDTERLTPLQQNWIRVLKGDTSSEAIDALYNSPDPNGFQGYTLPPLNLPFEIVPPTTAKQPLPKRSGLPSTKKSRTGRKKTLAIPITRQ